MSYSEFLAQICCICAIFIWNLSIQNKEFKNILYCQFLANLLYSMEYFLLGATIAGFMDLTSSFRCYVFYYKNKNNQPISKNWLIFFCILIIIFGILNYTDPKSLIPPILTLFYTISSYTKETNWTRVAFIIAAFFWMYYNFCVKAYIGAIGNLLEVVSGLISILRFKKAEI